MCIVHHALVLSNMVRIQLQQSQYRNTVRLCYIDIRIFHVVDHVTFEIPHGTWMGLSEKGTPDIDADTSDCGETIADIDSDGFVIRDHDNVL